MTPPEFEMAECGICDITRPAPANSKSNTTADEKNSPPSNQVSRPLEAQATYINATSLVTPDNVEWNVVRLRGEGYGKLCRVPVQLSDNGVVAIEKVKNRIGTTTVVKATLNKILYFGEEAIFEASITSRIKTGDETQHTFVDVGAPTYDALLTAAYNGRLSLAGNTDLVKCNMRFAREDKAMVIGWRVNKKYTVGCILVSCLISVGLGVLVGVTCHNAGLGVGVGSGAAALLAVIAFILMKLAK